MTIQSIRFGQAKFDVGRGLSHGLRGRCLKDEVSQARNPVARIRGLEASKTSSPRMINGLHDSNKGSPAHQMASCKPPPTCARGILKMCYSQTPLQM